MFHHRSWFPAVVAILTLALGLTVSFSLYPRPTPPSPAPAAVSSESYRASVKGVLDGFDGAYATSSSDLAKLAAVEQALASLLALTVPGEERGLHLAVATALNQMAQGLRGAPGALERGTKALEAARAGAPWLR
ncbi:hypothetical protein EPO34_04190 [Patescibacteria group bacterium]|nr:MAG: hypothetical protein EPO34_04190 [Patescibacteria group bacterium]